MFIDLRGLVPFLVGTGIVGGAVLAGGTWAVTSYFNKEASPLVSLSEGRQQLMREGFVGTQDQFKRFLSAQVDDYFKINGYPCEPGQASKEVATTVARAKCTAPAPK